MVALTIGMAELVGTVLQSCLYGVYLVLFAGCLYVSLGKQRGRRRPINKFLFTVTIVLFILITSHWIIQILRLLDAFIYGVDGEPDKYYGYGANPKNVAKTALYVAQTVVGDCTMIYRLYVVWGRNWKIIVIPSILTVGLTGAGAGVVYAFSLIVFATTLTTNVIVTTLISYRVWSIHRQVATTAQQRITPVIHVIMDSALIYTFFLVLTHAGYLAKNVYQFIALDMASPAIGIAFSLIIVRVGLGLGSEEKSSHWQGGVSDVNFSRSTATAVQDPIPLSALAIKISKRVDMHRDDEVHDRDDEESATRSSDLKDPGGTKEYPLHHESS
ncbi:hypothetical protein BD779DRAFT_1672005 [Infundibulicybe gibba]|nr:hypothetical protein BD779DRAFT_1672005 [Infundibulicybe gibba]